MSKTSGPGQTYTGDSGNNTLRGTDADDILRGHRGDDTLAGGGGNDVVRGGRGDDSLSGGGGDDTVRGGPGSDHIYNSSGDDRINGGKGDDTVLFRGNYSDYTITQDSMGRYHVTDNVAGRDGNDIIRNVEHFKFADMTYDTGGMIAS